MGCALSAAEKEAEKKSEAIDRGLAAEGQDRSSEIKLLLLGEFQLVFKHFGIVAHSPEWLCVEKEDGGEDHLAGEGWKKCSWFFCLFYVV